MEQYKKGDTIHLESNDKKIIKGLLNFKKRLVTTITEIIELIECSGKGTTNKNGYIRLVIDSNYDDEFFKRTKVRKWRIKGITRVVLLEKNLYKSLIK